MAGDKLIVLPLANIGGAFPMVERDARTGAIRKSRKWEDLITALRQIPDLALVVLDTMNTCLHGSENDALVINEFVQATMPVICGEFKASLFVTHHTRKAGNEPIRNGEDMKTAVRGSSALIGAFRVVLGIWHAPDYERRLSMMGWKPEKGVLFRMEVLKANNPQMLQGAMTLARRGTGLLADVTALDKFNDMNFIEREAWLLMAIQLAAKAGHPYSREGKNSKNGLYCRRSELPDILRMTGWREFEKMVDRMLDAGTVIACAVKGSKAKIYLDDPKGPLAMDQAGSEIAKGAYRTIPKWEAFQFDPVLQRIVAKT